MKKMVRKSAEKRLVLEIETVRVYMGKPSRAELRLVQGGTSTTTTQLSDPM